MQLSNHQILDCGRLSKQIEVVKKAASFKMLSRRSPKLTLILRASDMKAQGACRKAKKDFMTTWENVLVRRIDYQQS